MKNDKPWIPFIWIFGIVLIVLLIIGIYIYCNNIEFDLIGIYTESIGMLLDVLFLGIIWSFFEFRRNKRSEINRYLEEIDDYRNWKNEEATFRIVGNIRRLSKLNFSKIDLNYCYLKRADLWNFKNTGDAVGADFSNANLAGAELCNIDLSFAVFENAHLFDSKLCGSNILNTNFKGTNLKKVDFRGCKNIDKAYFYGALYIWEALFDENIDIETLKLQQEKIDILGKGEPFFKKVRFIERIFKCSLMEFHLNEIDRTKIDLRITKEGFYNHKNLIKIIGENKNYFICEIKVDDLLEEMQYNNE